MIADGAAWRNQRSVRVLGRRLETGDVIDLLRPPDGCQSCPWRPEPVEWVWRDSWLAVGVKPAGELSQPAGDAPEELAFDDRARMVLALEAGRRVFVRLVHRLDRLTSGLVVLATAPQALAPLQRAWTGGAVERLYLAVVAGRADFEHTECTEPLARAPNGSWRFLVHPEGRPARTHFEVLERRDDTSVLACSLDTGRTHQVRVHLAHLGLPVVGDRLYGGPPGPGPGIGLHAWRLRLPHPRTGDRLDLEAPPPDWFTAILGTHGAP